MDVMRGRVAALEGEVVDGEHGGHVLPQAVALETGFEVGGDGGGVPVLAMNDVGPPVELRDAVQHRQAKKAEALCVVLVFVGADAVGLLASEEPFVFDEVERYVRIGDGCDAQCAMRHFLAEVGHAHAVPLAGEGLGDALVARHGHADVVSARPQRFGQGIGDFGEAAGAE